MRSATRQRNLYRHGEAVLQRRDMDLRRHRVWNPIWPESTQDRNYTKLTPHREDCRPGTCHSGACHGAREYALDGKCGPKHQGLKCGGKWGDCCSIDGICGTGPDFCGARCQSGNCTAPDKADLTDQPVQIGTTKTGNCGGDEFLTCDPRFGACCGADGTCGSGPAQCGQGW